MSFASHFDCPICGQSEKEIKFYGFSYCNHPICGVCAIKLQKFSKDDGKSDYDYSKCVICKQEISKIIIASSIKQFEDFDERNLLCNNKYALLFESTNAQKFYDNIMQIVCPQCKTLHNSMSELIEHMEKHKKRYCELCLEFNKCLHFELEIYTDNDYHNHRTKKHPKCRFCEIRFYDDSHLIKHVKDKHFVCDICHRNQGCTAYSTQIELLKHYAKDHFVCEICRVSNIINVFESEYNLKTHKVSAHKNSLVGEGLVNVGFGDRDMRYGARRRARDQDEGLFAEPPTVEIPQTLPTMHCEQEFPRLGGTAETTASNNTQLGTQSLTLDENDARTAFSSSNHRSSDDKKAFKKPAAPLHQPNQSILSSNNKPEKMADNFAISVKKSAGILNSEDFPSLSSNGGGGGGQPHHHQQQQQQSDRSSLRSGMDLSRAVKSASKFSSTSSKSSAAFAVRNKEAEFPSLSSGSRPQQQRQQPSNGSVWNKSGGKSAPARPNQHQQHNGDSGNLDTSTTVESEPSERPKVSLMSQEEFQLATEGNKSINQIHQSIPTDQDFPSLLGCSSTAGGTAGSTWGTSGAETGPTFSAVKKTMIINNLDNNRFTLDSKSDFPGLPASRTNQSVGNASGTKKKGKSGFASVASSNASHSGKPQVFSMAANNKPVPIAPKMELACAFEHPPSKQPASLRGIDYIPSVAPSRDPLVVVDSKQFSIMKQAKERQLSASSGGGGQFPGGSPSTEDFPPMQPSSAASLSTNHFDAFSNSNFNDLSLLDATSSTNKKNKESAKVVAPKISSETDFPSLGAPKAKQGNNKKKIRAVAQENPKSIETQPTEERRMPPSAPVISLMDVAMCVAKKNYFEFPDNNERNQSMCTSLFENLTAEMATQFLQLSNLYRTRQLSVHDYLESLHNDFVENLEIISKMLPQMCVLLPDIPLQRSLMTSMPKAWSRDLRECTKCDQVLLTSDIPLHNKLAH